MSYKYCSPLKIIAFTLIVPVALSGFGNAYRSQKVRSGRRKSLAEESDSIQELLAYSNASPHLVIGCSPAKNMILAADSARPGSLSKYRKNIPLDPLPCAAPSAETSFSSELEELLSQVEGLIRYEEDGWVGILLWILLIDYLTDLLAGLVTLLKVWKNG